MEDLLQVKFRAIKNKSFEFMNQMLCKHNLTRSEFEILTYIYQLHMEGTTANASILAKYFEVSIPAVLHKLEALEKKGMLQKNIDSADKRTKYYTITEEVEEWFHKLYEWHKAQLKLFLEALGEEKCHLEKILNLTLKFLEDEHDKIA